MLVYTILIILASFNAGYWTRRLLESFQAPMSGYLEISPYDEDQDQMHVHINVNKIGDADEIRLEVKQPHS